MSQAEKIICQGVRVNFRGRLQHYLNPLHVYCRLRDWGVSPRLATRVSTAYERVYRVCAFGSCKGPKGI